MIRLPCQAGAFYAGSLTSLQKQIEECFLHRLGPQRLPQVGAGSRTLLSLVSPHAGYMYSGPVAAHGYFFAALDGRPDTFIILGPNHTGYGSGVSIMVKGTWKTPLGDVTIDNNLAQLIQRNSELIDIDDSAHKFEHSIEVQLPFLQYVYGTSFKFIPICMMMQDLETSRDVGEAIAQAIRGKNAVIIASTDMSHYVSQDQAKIQDRYAIEAMRRLDAAELQSTVETHHISMCGYGPVSAAIIASKQLGASRSQLLSYQTSGDISGDLFHVVGYASMAITT